MRRIEDPGDFVRVTHMQDQALDRKLGADPWLIARMLDRLDRRLSRFARMVWRRP